MTTPQSVRDLALAAGRWRGSASTIVDAYSIRFGRQVIVTRHAAQRMAERGVTDALLLRLIDEGNTRYRDASHFWTGLDLPDRVDNLVCAVLVLDDAVIVKTLSHHWELMP